MKARAFTVENRQRAREALNTKIAAGAHYRRDWADAEHWETLAADRGIRLPAWWVAPSPSALKKWFRKLRKGEVFSDVYGHKMTAAKLIALNPTMSLRAFVGQMLEQAA